MRYIVVISFVFMALLSVAQSDTIAMTDNGPMAVITHTEGNTVSLSPVGSEISIVDGLSRYTSMQIQTQGPAFLTTGLYRGQGARHMAILWEGVNIQNSINGTYDLRLLPTSAFNNSKWYHGGHSALIGNAAMAGALVLDDQSSYAVEIGMDFNTNDANDSNLGYGESYIRLSDTNSKLTQSLNLSHTQLDNAYRYEFADIFNPQTEPSIERRENSEFTKFDMDYKLQYLWSHRSSTSFRYWYQDADRHLPSSLIAGNIVANQVDVNTRLSLQHNYQVSDQLLWKSQIAYMDENLEYFQPGIDSRANNYIYQLQTYLVKQGRVDQIMGLQYRTDLAKANFFEEAFRRSVYSAYYNAKIDWRGTSYQFSARQEWLNSEAQRPVIDINADYKINEHSSLQLALGSHYSYPGFNDLYWPQGGNSDLLSEYSYQASIGAQYRGLSVSTYYTDTSNKIVWGPTAAGISPENREHTQSYGLELNYQYSTTLSKGLSLMIRPSFYETVAVNISDDDKFDGKQLIYLPLRSANADVELKFKDLMLSMNASHTGKRFLNNDNTNALSAYTLLDARVSYELAVRDYKVNIYSKVNNILDQSYELVRYYPQALRSINLGFNIKFN